MAWIGNEDTGGIVDMFLDDTVNADKRAAKKLNLKNKKKNLGKSSGIRKYCPECGTKLNKMGPG